MLNRTRLTALIIALALIPLGNALGGVEEGNDTRETVESQRRAAVALYRSREKGLKLYAEKKYEEAFPHLMAAAKGGFKMPQAQLGFMHLQGLGGAKKDTRFALGWLGVAADGVTDPSIRNYFNDIWERIPAENQPAYKELVGNFVAKYGADTNDVKCQQVNKVASKIKQLRCMITDPDGRVITDMRDDADRYAFGSGALQSVGGSGQ